MAEENRLRKKQLQIRLLDDEKKLLEEKTKKSKLTKSEYVRMLIAYGGARGIKINHSDEEARKLCYELNRIGNNVNQIAYRVNLNSTVDPDDFENLQNAFDELLECFHTHVMG